MERLKRPTSHPPGRVVAAIAIGGGLIGCSELLGIQDFTVEDASAVDGAAVADDANDGTVADGAGPDREQTPIGDSGDAPMGATHEGGETGVDAGDATAEEATAGDADAGDAAADSLPDAIDASSCATTELACDGGCVTSGIHNCGRCGGDCTNLAHVSGPTTCSLGQCAFPQSSCAPGWNDCNGDPTDGCETDVTQAAHCGSCNNACTTATPTCSGSGTNYACVSTCPAATPTACGAACVDTTSNPKNCGSCNQACSTSVTHAQPVCAQSACSFACNSGYTSCSGACVDTTADPNNCSACGTPCQSGAQCVNSACQCPSGTLSCGGVCASCSTPSNASAACNGTACDFSCNSGYAKCGATCIDLTTDVNNCGSCGNGCGSGNACSVGRCDVVLATTGSELTAITADGANVYWASGGKVLQCAASGCGGNPIVLSSAGTSLFGIATDTANVYFPANLPGSTVGIVSVPIGGGTATTLATAGQPECVAVGGGAVFWGDVAKNQILTCATTGCGGTPTLVANGPSGPLPGAVLTSIAASATTVYWSVFLPSVGQILSCGHAGGCGSSPTVIASNQDDPEFMTLNGTNLYWTTLGSDLSDGGKTGGVFACPGASCAGNPSAIISDVQGYYDLATDGANVYWITGRSVMKCPITGCGGSPTTLASASSTSIVIALDATSVYWGTSTQLMKTAK